MDNSRLAVASVRSGTTTARFAVAASRRTAEAPPTIAPRATIEVEARKGVAFEVKAGELLRIIDVEGRQVGDLVAYFPEEAVYLSPVHTRGMLNAIRWEVGDNLWSYKRTPLLRVIADDVGCHDLLFPACDDRRYELDYGQPDHPNCRDNLRRALAKFGLDPEFPEPVNVFMNVPVRGDGTFQIEEPRSRPGDSVTFEALVDLVVGLSACPQDSNPCNGWNPTGLRLEVGPPAR